MLDWIGDHPAISTLILFTVFAAVFQAIEIALAKRKAAVKRP